MYKFAVCDDEREMIEHISDKISEYFPGECEIKKYTNGKNLLADSRHELFDAYFLDISMPNIGGLELAGMIRKDNRFAKIIFVTNHAELAHMGYMYDAFRYVRKSVLERELREAVLDLGEFFALHSDQMIFKTAIGEFTKAVKYIKYFEVYGHNVFIACSDGEEQVQGTISEYEKRFCDMGFIRIHKSYLVNFRYIASVEKEYVYLTNNEKLPLSRNRVNDTKRRFELFLKNLKHGS
ncbi:MAG: LytTR family DNA-binding domain-containing protein [Oscillospiraceae bacterium]|nr:LytTR family DNA-binding domain-containing protein [Oscillospiraceae bacterium]